MGRAKFRKFDYVSTTVKRLIVGIYDPHYGIAIEDLTKQVWPNWRAFDGPKFRREAKYVERVIQVMREEEKAKWYKQVDEAMKADPEHSRVARAMVPPPDFMPHALKRGPKYWLYFNCVKRPHTDDVAKICEQKAEGLIRTAEFIRDAFKIPP